MLAPRQLKTLANVRLMRCFSVVLAEDFHMQTASNSMLARHTETMLKNRVDV